MSGCNVLMHMCPVWMSESLTSRPACWTRVVGTGLRQSLDLLDLDGSCCLLMTRTEAAVCSNQNEKREILQMEKMVRKDSGPKRLTRTA